MAQSEDLIAAALSSSSSSAKKGTPEIAGVSSDGTIKPEFSKVLAAVAIRTTSLPTLAITPNARFKESMPSWPTIEESSTGITAPPSPRSTRVSMNFIPSWKFAYPILANGLAGMADIRGSCFSVSGLESNVLKNLSVDPHILDIVKLMSSSAPFWSARSTIKQPCETKAFITCIKAFRNW